MTNENAKLYPLTCKRAWVWPVDKPAREGSIRPVLLLPLQVKDRIRVASNNSSLQVTAAFIEGHTAARSFESPGTSSIQLFWMEAAGGITQRSVIQQRKMHRRAC